MTTIPPEQGAERIRQLEMLNALSQAVAITNSFDALLATTAEILAGHFTFDRLSVSFYDEEADTLEFFGLHPASSQIDLPAGTSSPVPAHLRPLVDRAEAVLFPTESDRLPQQVVAAGLRSGMGAPLLHGGQVRGMLALLRRESTPYSEEALARLQQVADQIAPTIESTRLYRRLQKSENRYRTLFNQANEAIFLLDAQSNQMLDVNEQAARYLGYSREELLDMTLDKIDVAEEQAERDALLAQLWEKKQLVFERLHRRKDGTLVPVEVSAQFIKHEGQLIVQSFVRDISDRKALQAAAATVSSTLDLDKVLELILDEIGRVLPYDSAAIFLLSETEAEIVASRHLPLEEIGLRFPVEEDLFIQEMRQAGQPIILYDAQSEPAFKEWGTSGYIRGWMGVPLLSRRGLIGLLTLDSRRPGTYDVADSALAISFAHHAAMAVENARLHTQLLTYVEELEAAQTRLLQSEKLATIGELVAGVAHELNNPLASILLFLDLLKRRAEAETNKAELLLVEEQTIRARNIVESLLNFARQRAPQYQRVQVNEILENSLSLLSYRLKSHDADLSLSLAPNLPPTQADPYQLQQVFVNVLNNAYQAMCDSGYGSRLILRTETAMSRFRPTRAPREQEDQVIRIQIHNNGPIIPPESLSRIFDPFFTTKPEGQGTGLGLSISHGIIQEHGGHIWAESKTGEGVTFFIELPLLKSPAEQPAAGRDEVPVIEAGAERVLIADDEPTLRQAIQAVLEEEGLTVDCVADGRAALAQLEQREYALILSDIRMPGLDGIQFYQQVEERFPALASRLLFVTGDVVSKETSHFLEEHKLPYLVKPFDIETLLQRVAIMLRRKP